MTDNTDFMASLMKIPYFAQLAQDRGEQWLADTMATLETSSFDFGNYAYFNDSSDPAPTQQADDAVTAGTAPETRDLTVDDPATVAGADAVSHNASDIQSDTGTSDLQGAIGQHTAMAADAAASGDTGSGDQGTGSAADNNIVPNHFDDVWIDAPKLGDTVNYADFDRSFNGWIAEIGIYSHNRDGGGDFGDEANNVVINGFYKNMNLGAGDDQIYLGGKGEHDFHDTLLIDGGDGTDTLHLNEGTGFTITLGGTSDLGQYGGEVTITNVENVVGSDGNDNITGDSGNNNLMGGDGNDVLAGAVGNDVLDGGAGDDSLTGAAGTDTITGGDGNDTIDGGDDADTIDGGTGNDKLLGSAGNDTITGGDGNDTIDGGTENDKIDGGAGVDTITGGTGDDTITGGAGADVMTGGDGKDTFVFVSKHDSHASGDFDFITDFNPTDDKIDLSALSATDTFIFEGTGDFAGGGDPSVRYVKEASDTLIQIDTNGDGTADMQIKLGFPVDPTATNFVL